MKLNDLDKYNTAKTALKANFDIDLDLSRLDSNATRSMLNRIRGLMQEARGDSKFYKDQASPTYLKLVFMEQALSKHYSDLSRSVKKPKIVVENVEVEKSQVILAAQDMVDSMQKMLEQVNDMMVKELPALVDSIQSEMGVNESQQFSQMASAALQSANQSLMQAKGDLQNALNTITGQAPAGEAFGEMPPAGGEEIEASADVEALPEPEEMGPPEEPEEEPVAGAGRAKR